jgi:hypothetical protein
MQRRRIVDAPAILLAIAVLAGCGASGAIRGGSAGGSTNRRSSPRPPVRSAFATREDAVCAKFNAATSDVKAKSPSRRELEGVLPAHIALERAALNDLSKLAPPAAIRGEWRQVVVDRRGLANELADLLHALRSGDEARVEALASSKLRRHKSLLDEATRAGFNDCPGGLAVAPSHVRQLE